MPTNKQHTLDDLHAQADAVRRALAIPGVPEDEKNIYRQTLEKINAKITEMQDTSAVHTQQAPTTVRMQPGGYRNEFPEPTPEPLINQRDPLLTAQKKATETPIRIITPGGNKINMHAGSNGPYIGSSIEAAKDSELYNPSITITWTDGYSLTVTESECASRFRTTFRDCMSLKCISEGKICKMWRWDTPWRCAGFLRALGQFNQDQIPHDIRQLDYPRPTELQKQVFTHIFHKATEMAAKAQEQ